MLRAIEDAQHVGLRQLERWATQKEHWSQWQHRYVIEYHKANGGSGNNRCIETTTHINTRYESGCNR